MLDIGVGGGRTTLHFDKLFKEYIGVDYVESMIKASWERLHDIKENILFKGCDAPLSIY